MEGIVTAKVDFANHELKCRICFKSFGDDEHRIEISKVIEKKFREVTQSDLKLTNAFSSAICVVCNFQLKDFCIFKRNIIFLQKELFKFIVTTSANRNNVKVENQEWSEEVDVKAERFTYYEEQQYSPADPEDPEVKLFDEPTEFLDFSTDLNFDVASSNKEDSRSDRNHLELRKEIISADENVPNDEATRVNIPNEQMPTRPAGENCEIFQCNSCEFTSNSKISLRMHQRKTHSSNKVLYDCNECASSFESYQSFSSHKMKMHSPDKERTKWICQHCNTSFSGSRTLRDHITIMHSSMKPQIPCPVKHCQKIFLTTKRLRAHQKIHDNDAKEMCPECGLLVTSKHNLEKHIKRVHLKLRNFFCDICGYSATFRHSIASHMVSHIDPNERRKWNCDLCSFVSVSKQSLRAHKSYEHSGKVYTCHCGKEFNQRASLSTHIKCVHHKIKDHLCNLCGKAYFTRKDLHNHKKSQHMEKDMPCEICGKLFATQKHLTRHRLYHEDPKFKCNFEGCQKAFIDNAKLRDHIKLHEGNRDNLCHLCEKSYFHQKDLKRHLDVAHKATIFYCEICTFTISRKDYLRNHLNSAHKTLTHDEKNDILARTKVTRNSV